MNFNSIRIFVFAFCLLGGSLLFGQQTLPKVVLTDMNDQPIALDSLVGNGKITIISFWATWCAPCKKELDAIAEVYPDWVADHNVQLIAVSIDDARTAVKVKPMVAQKRWDYRIVIDANKDLANALNITNVPYTLLLNQKGEIVWMHSGYVPGGEAEVLEKIEALKK